MLEANYNNNNYYYNYICNNYKYIIIIIISTSQLQHNIKISAQINFYYVYST